MITFKRFLIESPLHSNRPFKTVVWHGSSSSSITKLRASVMYGTEDRGFAESYAKSRAAQDDGEPTLYQLEFAFKNLAGPEDIDYAAAITHTMMRSKAELEIAGEGRVMGVLIKQGYDGACGYDHGFRNEHEECSSYVVFNAAKSARILKVERLGALVK